MPLYQVLNLNTMSASALTVVFPGWLFAYPIAFDGADDYAYAVGSASRVVEREHLRERSCTPFSGWHHTDQRNLEMSDPAHSAPLPSRAVEIWSVTRRGLVTVRFLGQYVGILEHWPKPKGSRSIPCPGVAKCKNHTLNTIWKGYAPVEVWEPGSTAWWPFVLEITEALDELLHGQKLRGLVWSLFVDANSKERPAVQGTPLTSPPCTNLREAFDVRPIVARVAHCNEIAFGVANPTPRRLVLSASYGEAPEELFTEPETERKASVDDVRKVKEMLGEARKAWKRKASTAQVGDNASGKETSNGHS